MRIEETSTSLQRKIISMVLKVCPNLVCKERGNPLLFCQRGRLRHFLKGAGSIKLLIGHHWRVGSVIPPLFMHGKWEDIEIEVLDEKFIKPAERIGSTYEQETGKSVALIKKF